MAVRGCTQKRRLITASQNTVSFHLSLFLLENAFSSCKTIKFSFKNVHTVFFSPFSVMSNLSSILEAIWKQKNNKSHHSAQQLLFGWRHVHFSYMSTGFPNCWKKSFLCPRPSAIIWQCINFLLSSVIAVNKSTTFGVIVSYIGGKWVVGGGGKYEIVVVELASMAGKHHMYCVTPLILICFPTVSIACEFYSRKLLF